MLLRLGSLMCLCGAMLLAATPSGAQGVDSVTVEQRVLLTPDLTPAEARRRAIDGALAEAVRRVAGVRVQSNALSTVSERNGAVGDGAVRSGYSSVVQMDAAARAVDYHVVREEWETLRPSGVPPQLYLRLRLTAVIEREVGTADAAFRVELALNAPRFEAGSGRPTDADEVIATIRTSQPAQLILFNIADDSAQRLFPNDYQRLVRVEAGSPTELPDPEWRARGLRLRATLPAGRITRQELLMVVATRADVPPPPAALSLLELQRWLVRIPLGDRTIAVAPYEVHRTR
ncbi:MAG: DUF4384 domain-containing protein [Gemmatimonadaceae bacterium]|nr:DUF4384 domain-containing protein [Gemmatimonadaceae bacterium]